MIYPYDRASAVAYAHRWAYSRNPVFYDYSRLGGDCTSFVSQCILAGGAVMNYTPTFGWYYISANDKAPAWSGVPYLFQFLTRQEASVGPFGTACAEEDAEEGDIVQLSFDGIRYQHSLVIVRRTASFWGRELLVATHSDDADFRPLRAYPYAAARFLHLNGIRIQ